MKRCIRRIGPFLVFSLALCLPVFVLPTASADEVTAASADGFVESIGICTHWSYTNTPYGTAYEKLKQALLASGIRHLRDGLSPGIGTARVEDLGKLGLRFCIVAEPELGTPEEIREKVKALNHRVPYAIDAVEGPNEPDLFWVTNKKSYGGVNGADGEKEVVEAAMRFQKDLYTVFKADSLTRNIILIGPALGKTYEPDKNPMPRRSLTNYVDRGNFHPYFGGNPFSLPFAYGTIAKYLWDGTHPGSNIDEFPYALTTYSPPFEPKPMVATESGCATDSAGTSEIAHGKYIPRMFLEYFRKGIRRTYVYELIDEFTAGNSREARFGLLRNDLTAKPAYTALKNLIDLLNDKGTPFKPGSLDFSLTVSPVGEYTRTQYVHSLLLQKRNGVFYLVLWHEIANEDKSVTPRRQISPPPLPALLRIASPVQSAATVFQWDEQGNRTETVRQLDAGQLALAVPDRVMVVRITPKADGQTQNRRVPPELKAASRASF